MSTNTFAISIATSSTSYASGDVLGVLTKLNDVVPNGRGGTVNSIVVADGSTQSAAMEIWFFSASVAAAADNAAWSLSDADASKCLGVATVSSYFASALNSVGVARSVGLSLGGNKDVWVLPVTRGTPTYGAATLTIAISVIGD